MKKLEINNLVIKIFQLGKLEDFSRLDNYINNLFYFKLKLSNLASWKILVMVIVVLALFGVNYAEAAGVVVEPSAIRFSLNPGQKYSQKITITNSENTAIKINLVPASITKQNPTGELEFNRAETGSFSDGIRLTISPATELLIAPEKSAQLNVEVSTNSSTTPNGYALGAIVEIESANNNGSPAAVTQKSLSSINLPILFEVMGVKQLAVDLTGFSVSQSASKGEPIAFNTTVKNQGNVHASVFGGIEIIDDATGKVTDSIKIERALILTNSVRLIFSDWNPGDRRGQFTARLNLKVSHNPNESVGSELTKEVKFEISNDYSFVYPIIGTVLVILFLSYIYRKRVKKSKC